MAKFRENLKYYVELSQNEDVFITSNNEVVALLTNPKEKAFKRFLEMEGCLKDSDDGRPYEEIIAEEILKR